MSKQWQGMNNEQITRAIGLVEDTEHVVAVFKALRDFNVRVLIMPPGNDPIDFRGSMNQRPFIAMVADDGDQALGPEGFHPPSLTELVKMTDHAAVISTAPVVDLYRMMSLMPSYLRTGSLIIETRPSHDLAWVRFLQNIKPDMPIVLSVPPQPEKKVNA
jgi:hypothetical protein